MSKKIITYDNHKYQELEIEETVAGSGRYKVQSRLKKTIYGVLDDEAIYNETESLVNDYISALGTESMVMLLSSQDTTDIYEVLSTLFALHASNYKSGFDAVLDIIKNVGVIASKPYKADNKIYFDVELYSGVNIVVTLQGYTSKVIVVDK